METEQREQMSGESILRHVLRHFGNRKQIFRDGEERSGEECMDEEEEFTDVFLFLSQLNTRHKQCYTNDSMVGMIHRNLYQSLLCL